MMYSIAVIIPLAFLTQATQPDADHVSSALFLDKLVDDLFIRAFNMSSLHHSDMETATLRKSRNLASPHQATRIPPSPSFHSRSPLTIRPNLPCPPLARTSSSLLRVLGGTVFATQQQEFQYVPLVNWNTPEKRSQILRKIRGLQDDSDSEEEQDFFPPVTPSSLKTATQDGSYSGTRPSIGEEMVADRIRNANRERMDVSGTEETVHSDAHPVLGKPLIDLGYKRVHVVSVKALKAIPVWKRQRIYRHDRAEAMADDKVVTAKLGLPGIISIYEDETGDLAIIDGQHRVGMLAILEERQGTGECLNLDQVLVEVFPQTHLEEFGPKDIFLEINMAEPVKLVDIPDVALPTINEIITEAADKLEESYPEMFKSTPRCRAPHVNIDNLRDSIFGAEVMKRHSLTTSESLVEWILAQNTLLKDQYENEAASKKPSVNAKALQKAMKYDFFLGLDSTWLYK